MTVRSKRPNEEGIDKESRGKGRWRKLRGGAFGGGEKSRIDHEVAVLGGVSLQMFVDSQNGGGEMGV